MQNATTPSRLVVDEFAVAEALSLSVHTVRKDRQHDRRIPFFKIGGAVRYNLDRVRAALLEMECGGPAPRPDARSPR